MVQTASGFGIAMVLVPACLWSGLTLPQAMGFTLGTAVVQVAVGLSSHWKETQLRHNLRVALGQWLVLPVALVAMERYLAPHRDMTQKFVGGVLIAVVSVMQLWRPAPQPKRPAWMAFPTGMASGLLGGLVGMGGPPLVLYGLSFDWQRDRFRVFLWSQFLFGSPVLLALLAWKLGVGILLYFCVGVLMGPVVYFATRLALLMTRKWNQSDMRTAATVLLYIIGILAVVR